MAQVGIYIVMDDLGWSQKVNKENSIEQIKCAGIFLHEMGNGTLYNILNMMEVNEVSW